MHRMAKPRTKAAPKKARGPTRTPAMKSALKSRAKAGSGRAPVKPKAARIAALLDALRAAPDDHELRLVFADALEETGELARAELVRCQTAVELDRADAATRARATALQADRDRAIGGLVGRWTSKGGVVRHVEARADEWFAHGAALFDAEPIVSITVDDPRELDEDFDYAQLAAQPWIAHVHALAIPAYSALAEPEMIVELLGAPRWKRLTQLTVPHPIGAIAVARHCALPQLRAMNILCEGSSEGDDAVRALAALRLTHLELVGCGMTPDGMRAIAAAKLPLVRLVTAGTHYVEDDIGEAGMRALVEAPALASLRELELETGGLDDAAMRVLAGAPWRLETLGLHGNRAITDDGIAMLAGSPMIASVRALNVRATAVTATGLATLPDHVDVTS